MATWYRIENEALTVYCDATEQECLRELGDTIQQDSALCDCFESMTCNCLIWVMQENIGTLTGAPILSEECPPEDCESYLDDAVFYYYGAYMLRSPLVELRDNGKVIFNKA